MERLKEWTGKGWKDVTYVMGAPERQNGAEKNNGWRCPKFGEI